MTRCAALGRGLGGHQPGRAGAHHQHVAERVHALVARGVPGIAGAAEAGGAADEVLAQHPEAGALQRADHRAHEGLVVEAGRDQLAGELVGRADIEGERREAVLADDGQPVMDLEQRRRDVGLADVALQHRHQRVRLVDAGGKHAARAVVFERAAEQADAVGKQRRGQRVAGIADIGLAVEGEADGTVRGRSARRRRCGAGSLAGSMPAVPVRSAVAGVAREADARDLVRQRVAGDGQMRAAAARMLPDLVVVAGRVQPVIDIGVPRLPGRSRRGRGAGGCRRPDR